MTKAESNEMTANQLVAYNLHRARVLRDLTQAQAAERLEPYLGQRWSKATFSSAERSVDPGTRDREFSANDILAFAAAFELPATWFLVPPGDVAERSMPERIGFGGEESVTPSQLIDMVFATPGESALGERLRSLFQALPAEGKTSRQRAIAEHAASLYRAASDSIAGYLSIEARRLREVADTLEQAHLAPFDELVRSFGDRDDVSKKEGKGNA